MKRLMFILPFLLGATIVAHSQRIVKKSVEVQGKKVEMKFSFADSISIETWDKNTIDLQVSVNIDDNRYNDHYDLKVKEEGNSLQLTEDVDFKSIPKEKSENNHGVNSYIRYKLKVPAKLDFDLNTISGNIVLKGTLGTISINSISGFVDYTIPLKQKASIDLSTISGNVYSDLKFDEKPGKDISWVGTKQKLTLNGGNTPITLKTISGDIFLRKGH